MLDEHKTEALYHAALILNRTIRTGTQKADTHLRKLLHTHGTFKEIYKTTQKTNIEGSLFTQDKQTLLDKLENNTQQTLEDIPGIQVVIRALENTTPFKTITITDDEYPQQITGTPVIYYRGDLSLTDTPTIAVVGTREPTEDDLKQATPIIEELINKGYTIASGLALGCDSLAHKIAIRQKAKTIAVIGTPLDKHYPSQNRELQEKIAQEHLLISQYPIGITTYPGHFAHRNHTTVSLSSAIYVIKAADKTPGKTSGTLNAVKAAKEQNKPIYALPINFTYNWAKIYEAKTPNDIPRP